MTDAGFPWINIPMFADLDEPQVFVGRREELAVLYRGLVQAGNAVRQGRFGIHRKFVIHGYLGVGKSALIMETLRLLREGPGDAQGQTADLPTPEDPERWLILRISGKHVTGLDGLVASLRWTMTDSGTASETADEAVYPRLALYEHVHRQAEDIASRALHLTPLHHLLRTREVQLYETVRTDLGELAKTLTQIIEQTHEIQARGGPHAVAAMGAGEEQGQREEAHSLVGALNRFFRGATAAGLPTLLILDDFDELAVTAGTSLSQRVRTLHVLLHELGQLAPTCLLVSLRSEFMNETLLRQFRRIFLPPLPRSAAAELLARWGEAQEPPLPPAISQRLQQLGERFLQRFAPDEPVITPFRFLQLVAWLANNYSIYNLAEADEARMLWRYVGSKYPLETVRALRRVLGLMPAEHIPLCAAASPLDGAPYALLPDHERLTLERSGLLRAATAAAADDPRIVLDPLIGYLRQWAGGGG